MSKCALSNLPCPRTNNPAAARFCPAWTEGVVWTNMQTGQEKVVHCALEMLMPAVIEVIKAANRPAAAVESTRNEIVRGFQALAGVLSLSAQQRYLLTKAMQENSHALESERRQASYQGGRHLPETESVGPGGQ